jgi:hypothetical protein
MNSRILTILLLGFASAVMATPNDDQRARFKASPAQAKELVSTGEWPKAQGIDPAEHAAWTMIASTLLNLDETLNKE